MTSARPRRPDRPAPLRWDGTALTGAATTRQVEVAVPARLVSFRQEEFPAAAEPALRAAIGLRAVRAFAAQGAVAAEALLAPAHGGRGAVLLLALPLATITAIRAAATAQNRVVTAIRVAELLLPVPVGGEVRSGGEVCLVAMGEGHAATVRALAVLGAEGDPALPARLERERLRLGVAEDAPGAAAPGLDLDFLHPSLTAATPLLARPLVRLGLLAAGIGCAALLAVAVMVYDALAERAAARGDADQLRPLATVLAAKRADLKEVAAWFANRPSLAPGLHALASALPAPGADGQVRLVRVRQTPGADGLAEGVAGDRAQLMAFLGRLRQDPRISSAEVRTFRSLTKGSDEVGFELVFRMSGDAHAKA